MKISQLALKKCPLMCVDLKSIIMNQNKIKKRSNSQSFYFLLKQWPMREIMISFIMFCYVLIVTRLKQLYTSTPALCMQSFFIIILGKTCVKKSEILTAFMSFIEHLIALFNMLHTELCCSVLLSVLLYTFILLSILLKEKLFVMLRNKLQEVLKRL